MTKLSLDFIQSKLNLGYGLVFIDRKKISNFNDIISYEMNDIVGFAPLEQQYIAELMEMAKDRITTNHILALIGSDEYINYLANFDQDSSILNNTNQKEQFIGRLKQDIYNKFPYSENNIYISLRAVENREKENLDYILELANDLYLDLLENNNINEIINLMPIIEEYNNNYSGIIKFRTDMSSLLIKINILELFISKLIMSSDVKITNLDNFNLLYLTIAIYNSINVDNPIFYKDIEQLIQIIFANLTSDLLYENNVYNISANVSDKVREDINNNIFLLDFIQDKGMYNDINNSFVTVISNVFLHMNDYVDFLKLISNVIKRYSI